MLMTIFNFFYAFVILFYIILSTIKVAKELKTDLKTPFLGFASTYLFNYFFSCFLVLLMCFFSITFIILDRPLDYKLILLCYCLHTYSIYNGVIFLIKKYNFKNIKNELFLTSILQLFCFLSIAFACSCPYFRLSNTKALTTESYSEIVYFLVAGLGNTNIFYKSSDAVYSLLTDLKLFPLIILGAMWIKSLGKSYNKCSHSYFVKSANHPIFFFLFYEFLFISLAYYDFHNIIELSILIGIIFILKFIFSVKILFWLKNKDMEEIETNAILRSQRNVINPL